MTETTKKGLRITVLLPLPGTNPIGGFKVAYEYANYFAKRGHSVSVVHPARYLIDKPLKRLRLNAVVRTIWLYLANMVTGKYKPTSWFKVFSDVKLLWVPSLAPAYIPDGDIVVATAWETAEWAQQYPRSKGMKFYLLQHLETWSGPEERVYATWKMPLKKIAISGWLQKVAESFGEQAYLVQNGLDFERFKLTNPPEFRDPYKILMSFSNLEWKGSADGLAAFSIARLEQPELKMTLFSVDPPPGPTLPSGVVEFFHDVPQQKLRELYNQAAIFVLPSWTEGFGLPAAEALQCGAALAVTDIEGTASFAIQDETALRSPVRDPQALAANILRLVRDPDLRLQLAYSGHEKVQEFTWERAGAALERIFLASLEEWDTQPEPPPIFRRWSFSYFVDEMKKLIALQSYRRLHQ